MIVVSDTTPILSLLKCGQLELLIAYGKYYQLICSNTERDREKSCLLLHNGNEDVHCLYDMNNKSGIPSEITLQCHQQNVYVYL